MRASPTVTAQVVLCLVCAACALMPLVEKTRSYWGDYGASVNHGPPRLHQVERGSPAERDGLRVDDIVLSADGSPPLNDSHIAAPDQLKPGGSVVLHVRRGERNLDITAHGVEPEIAAIYYPHMSVPITGGMCVALGLLVFSTGPLRPVPVWMSAVVMVVGLAAAVVFFLVLAVFGPFDALTLRQYWPRSGLASYGFALGVIGFASSLLVSAFGAWELRATLARKLLPERIDSPAA